MTLDRARRRALLVVAGLVPLLATSSLGVSTAGADTPAPVAPTTPPVLQRTSSMVTTDPLPTAQINGVVYAQTVVDGVVYAGGSFSSARPAGAAAGTSEVPRGNLMAYDLKSGELVPFAPELNGRVKTLAVSADRKTLFVGGTFTMVGTKVRNRFAAFSLPSGKLQSLAPDFNAGVNALAVSGKVVYAGGDFSTVWGNPRTRLAAVKVSKKKLTSWAPTADSAVQAMTLTPDKKGLVVGGSFTTLNSSAASGMGLLSATDGKSKTWKINKTVKDGSPKSAVLALTADKDTVYGTAFAYGGGNFEGVFAASPKDGTIRWLEDCHGDTYGVVPVGDVIYSVGHAHFCGNIGGFPDTKPKAYYRAIAASKAVGGTVAHNTMTGSNYGDFAGRPAPSLYNWFPELRIGTYTGTSQAAWSIAASGGYLLLGGEFLAVNGFEQQGLVRLRVPDESDRKQGPVLSSEEMKPTATATGPGALDVSWPTSYDRDDLVLSYELVRDGTVVATRSSSTPFWLRAPMHVSETGLEVGRTYSYVVRVADGDQNVVESVPLDVVAPADAPATTPPPTPAPTPAPGGGGAGR